MEPGQSEAKRPRLHTSATTWGPHQGTVLPPPTHPPQPHLHPPASPYHPSIAQYPRASDPAPHQARHHHEERRHHEQDIVYPPPPPIQDHRQPPPSPVHTPHYGSYRRDSVVKRESADENSLPQMRRPNSTDNTPNGHHGPAPPPPYPSQHPDEHRRPPSFDSNGPSVPQSPQLYRPPPQPAFHPPHTPVAQHHQYEAPSGYGPAPPVQEVYSSIPVANAKRKAQRASQACDMCRQLKAKCDEQKPCKNCSDKNTKCVYRDLPTKQPDKVSADILDLMNALKSQITNEFGRMDQRMTRMEHAMKLSEQGYDMKIESVEHDNDGRDKSDTPEMRDATEMHPMSPRDNESHVMEARATLRQMAEEEIENQPGAPIPPGQPSLPADHKTLAAFLLQWAPIHSMVAGLLKDEGIHHIEEFPIREEQQRGLLRVFGKGEGWDQDFRSTSRQEPSLDTVMTEINDDNSDAATPLPIIEAWGQVGGISPPNLDIYKGGVLNTDGRPDFDPHKVKQYIQSFKDNILNMHPILVPKQLDAMVTVFLDSLPQQSAKSSTKVSSAKFVNSNGNSNMVTSNPEVGTKRKRSPAAEEQSPSMAFQKPGLPFRNIHSALVLSALALGKLCQHKDKIPDLVPDHELPVHSSPSIRNGILASPSQGSPPGFFSHSQSSSVPSPKDGERGFASRRPSLQGPAMRAIHPMKRNIDVVPGLEYYGLAADIFGSHIGGNSIHHVYVALFLGLYHGQLGRVLESWSYIALAGRTLQVILRPSMRRLVEYQLDGKVPGTRRDNMLCFAFWSCAQLESDILAELPMPQSGILSYEGRMPYPNLSAQATDGYPTYVVTSYQAQLYLRKYLNKIHKYLYSQPIPGSDEGEGLPPDETLEEKMHRIQFSLKGNRSSWVPREFTFLDQDPPATDILAARLRAKYWGSQVILYRPYIEMVLNGQSSPENLFRNEPPPPSEWASRGIDVGGINVPAHIDPRAISYARLGIAALVESTRAFHGLDGRQRLLVTNVFTTAQAQWGNLLVLSACFRDPVLRHFINQDLLQALFLRTIDFFRMISQPSSPLTTVKNVLIRLAQKLELVPDEFDPRATSSFSSITSTGAYMMHNPNDNYHPGTPVMAPPPRANT